MIFKAALLLSLGINLIMRGNG